MPEITRPVLVKLEHGRREAVSAAELAVLAAALDIAPVLLLYPVGSAGFAEYLPGRTAAPWDAAVWSADEAFLGPDGAISLRHARADAAPWQRPPLASPVRRPGRQGTQPEL